jgi:hypothetical protein
MPTINHGGIEIDWTDKEAEKIRQFRKDAQIRRMTLRIWRELTDDYREYHGITQRSIEEELREASSTED